MDCDNNSDESISYSNELEKLYELPLSVINALKPVFNLIHPTQLVYQLCDKIKELYPLYTYSEDDNYKYKCTANLKSSSINVIGYNDQKKEAKKIASEMVVLELIKNKQFRNKIIPILVKDYNVNSNVFQFKKKKKSKPDNAKENDIKSVIKSDTNTSFEKQSEEIGKMINRKRERGDTNGSLDLFQDKVDLDKSQIENEQESKIQQSNNNNNNSPCKEAKMSVSKVKCSGSKNKERRFKSLNECKNTLDINIPEEFTTNQIQSTLLNFELFCIKWERSLLLDKETILYISKFIQNISMLILKIKTKMNIQDSYAIGSYISSSLRLNYLVVDYLLVLNSKGSEQGSTPKNNFEEFIEYAVPDVIKNDYQIDIKKETDCSYLEIVSKEEIKCKIQFIQIENSKQYSDHIEFISQSNISIEQEIALKIIKAWRRSKGLLYLNPIIIEVIVLYIDYPMVNKIIISFFVFLTNLDEEFFVQDYQKELIGNLKLSIKYPKLIEEVKIALDVIKSNNFSDLF